MSPPADRTGGRYANPRGACSPVRSCCAGSTTEFLIMIAWLRGAGLALARQFAKFGVVGAVAYVIDVGVFNVLRYAGEDPVLADQPLTAKIMSSAVATVVSWLGNRYWTFRHTRRPQARREFLIFVLMCSIGLGISLSILWFSHYVIGLTSPLADNIAANVVGLAAGTLFRFWAYRRFVFTHTAEPAASPVGEAADPRLESAPF